MTHHDDALCACPRQVESGPFFFSRVLPSINLLASAYKELGGVCLTATLLREPIAYLFSAFMYHPPCHWQQSSNASDCSAASLIERFPTWAGRFWGGQVGRLLVRPAGRSFWVTEAGPRAG